MKGWVYVISNKAMPDLVKVGYSSKDPELRANELNHTGSPHPYVVEYELLIENPYHVEQQVHGVLAAHREGKEWFRCSPEAAVIAIKQVAGSNVISEDYKKLDREHAEEVRRQKIQDAESAARKRNAAAVVEQRLTAEESAIRSRYSRLIEQKMTLAPYWAYWIGCAATGWIALTQFFPKGSDVAHLGGGAVIGWIGASILREVIRDGKKTSSEVTALQQACETELSSVRSIFVACPNCGQSLRFARAQVLDPNANIEWHCPACGADYAPFNVR